MDGKTTKKKQERDKANTKEETINKIKKQGIHKIENKHTYQENTQRILTFRRLTLTIVDVPHRQPPKLHFIYLFNKYRYRIF